MPLIIGTTSDPLGLWRAEYTRQELARVGVETQIAVIDTPEAALLRGEISAAVHAMQYLPIKQAEGLVITAVSMRDNPAECLLIRPEAFSATEIFKLKKGISVGSTSGLRTAQMKEYRPDMSIQHIDGNLATQLAALSAGAFDALIASAAELNHLAWEPGDLQFAGLNPYEFVPAPAQGVLAWQCHKDDLATRRIFKQLHQPAVSACTNIERAVQVEMDAAGQSILGVYCEQDGVGNYHCFACAEWNGEMRRVRHSSSTRAGMAQKIIRMMVEG